MTHRPGSRRLRRHRVQASVAALAAAGLVVLTGCSKASDVGGGSLISRSLSAEASRLPVDVATAIYAHDPTGDTIVVISDVPLESLLEGGLAQGQLVVIDLLWPPRAGSTPMDPSATNASIRHLVVTGGEAGSYAGAGFVRPTGRLGQGPITFRLADSTVRLVGATDGFRDLLSPARLSGRCSATENADAVRRIVRWSRVVAPDGPPVAQAALPVAAPSPAPSPAG